jgi:hypothetical protein
MRYIIFYSLLFILATNFLSNAVPLGASIGFASISSPDIFGEQRVFGTIGFGITAFAASRIYGVFRTDFVYIIMFGITMFLCMIVTSFIRVQPDKINQNSIDEKMIVQETEMDDLSGKEKKKKKKKIQSPFQLSALFPLLKKIDVIVFLSLTLIWGMSYAGLDPVSISISYLIIIIFCNFSIYIYISMKLQHVNHIPLLVGCH